VHQVGHEAKVILRCTVSETSKFGKGLEWIHLAQDRDQKRILTKAATNRHVPVYMTVSSSRTVYTKG